jgi:4-amino-4-deoxy-L-arabinose transferase-like glycosyltransferase
MMPGNSPATRIVVFVVIATWIALHIPLLVLPYYWDEAGYFIPAAYDFYTKGALVVQSVVAEPHPPLVAVMVAIAWKAFGFSAVVARSVVLALGAAALGGIFRLSSRVTTPQVGLAAVVCTALYPVFFVQSSLVHLDIAVAAFGLWALAFYFEERLASSSLMFCLAVLAKETAILLPLVLAAWELGAYILKRRTHVPPFRPDWRRYFALAAPVIVLGAWFGYYLHSTGSLYGDADFVSFNIETAFQPLRALAVLPMRIWHAVGYMNLFVLSALALIAVIASRSGIFTGRFREPVTDEGTRRVYSIVAVLVAAHVLAFSLIGGAILARYMLPVIPLVILISLSCLAQSTRHWKIATAVCCVAFVSALFVSPTYQYDRADNLAYRKFVMQQQEAVQYVSQHYSQGTVSTAWPATEGFRTPYLGYLARPFSVSAMKDFSRPSLVAARDGGADFAVLFSREQPSQTAARPGWERLGFLVSMQHRFFQSLPDLSRRDALQVLGGRVLWSEASGGEWIAVVKLSGPTAAP